MAKNTIANKATITAIKIGFGPEDVGSSPMETSFLAAFFFFTTIWKRKTEREREKREKREKSDMMVCVCVGGWGNWGV
jgi:hypothetical protein